METDPGEIVKLKYYDTIALRSRDIDGASATIVTSKDALLVISVQIQTEDVKTGIGRDLLVLTPQGSVGWVWSWLIERYQ